MDHIFGISPVDSALSAFGLSLSQTLMDFLFNKSQIAYLSFSVGFCYHIFKCSKEVNYRPLLGHFAIFLACLIILWTDAHDESTVTTNSEIRITSAWESYCTQHNASPDSTTCRPSTIKTQDLISSQISSSFKFSLLSYLAEAIDSFSIGSINALTQLMPETHIKYLTHPFGIQDTALRLHEEVKKGIIDLSLKGKVQNFIYVHYLPALIMLKNKEDLTNLSLYGPNHIKITELYSDAVKNEWITLREDIKTNYLVVGYSTWDYAKKIFNSNYSLWNQSSGNVDDIYIDALIRTEAGHIDEKHASRSDWLWQLANGLLQGYPYAQGLVNLLLYVIFPLVLCLSFTFARLDFLFYWALSFFWIKSWVLTAALAYWVSLMMASAQFQTVGGIKWFWQEPYFALGAGILVYVLPLIMFFIVFKGINFVYQQSVKEVNHVSSI
jgi:hypothetical protein